MCYNTSVKHIKLSQSKNAIVDDSLFERLNRWKWYCSSYGYATKTIRLTNGKQKRIMMHRFILKAQHEEEVDHINGDRLDNRLCNLRIVTHSQNQRNKKKRSDNKSGFIGVSWDAREKKWRAQAMREGKQIHLGLFNTPSEAARCRDLFVLEHYGGYARLNY